MYIFRYLVFHYFCMVWPIMQLYPWFNKVIYNWVLLFEPLSQAVFFFFFSLQLLFWRYFYSLGYKCKEKKSILSSMQGSFGMCLLTLWLGISTHFKQWIYLYAVFIKYAPPQSKHKPSVILVHTILVSNGIFKIFRNILILYYRLIKFPKPTHFQCVHHMYMLDFILCCNYRPASHWN